MSRRQRKPIIYDPHELPFRLEMPIQVSIDRKLIPELCRQLHDIVLELGGAAFYIPNVARKTNLCRYEWPRKKGKRNIALRLGLLLNISDDDLKEIIGYVSTNKAIANKEESPPDLSANMRTRLNKEFVSILTEVEKRMSPESKRLFHIVFHIEIPYRMSIENEVQTKDQKIHIFPTNIVKEGNKRVSAVSIAVEAASNRIGKSETFHDIALLSALLTLASGQIYRTISLTWSPESDQIEYLDSLNDVNVKRLYPYRKNIPSISKNEVDYNISQRLNFVWNQFQSLSNEDRKNFICALFAYYSGKDIHGKQPTLAVVAYVAALNSLVSDEKQECSGKITCSKCGILDFKHYKVGDKRAIVALISKLLELKKYPEVEQKVEKLIECIYNKQRSAFVHGAVLRHKEYYDASSSPPPAFPTMNESVTDLYHFQNDLHSLERLTRWTLLSWLTNKLNVLLDQNLLYLESLQRIVRESPMQSTISLNSEVAIRIRNR